MPRRNSTANWTTCVALLVADSGPLIALARLSLLRLPTQMQHEVLVPSVVWTEVTRAAPEVELQALESASASGWLTVAQGGPGISPALDGIALDDGELAALNLALHHNAPVLVDELRGRAAAAQLGLPVVGTLGLLMMARERGLIGGLQPLVEALAAGGYYLSRSLIAHVLANDGK
jgi:predicted nucleic acid-binding protein